MSKRQFIDDIITDGAIAVSSEELDRAIEKFTSSGNVRVTVASLPFSDDDVYAWIDLHLPSKPESD